MFEGKSVLITGGTGSFGHHMVKELLKTNASAITIFSRDEEKQWEMSREFPDQRMRFVIGDVRDRERVFEVLNADYVYHAAALKIIPICEANPTEAYKTNLVGTMNVRDACVANNVKRAILVSTDKAVKPVNAYGMSKALAEKVWLMRHPVTVFTVVRYGNVLGSRGSVVPYFKDLIKEGKPIPVTHTSMSRFFLNLQEAIELVWYATMTGSGGEVFVRRSPACKIADLAIAMAGPDYPIRVIGVRPGEKIAEVLISEEEIRRTEEQNDYYIVHPYGAYSSSMVGEFTSDTARQLGVSEIASILRQANLSTPISKTQESTVLTSQDKSFR